MWFVFEDLKLRSLSAVIMIALLFLIVLAMPFFLVPSIWILNVMFLRELFNLYNIKKQPSFYNLVLIAVCIFPLYFSQTNLALTISFNFFLFFLVLYWTQSKGLSFCVVYVNLSIACILSLLVSQRDSAFLVGLRV